MSMEIVHNRCGACFKAMDGEREVGILQYSIDNGTMNIFHTFVEPDMRGRGIASEMTARAEAFAKEEGLKTVATCSYAAAKLK
ncbi:MAG: N-acetyltransferase [Thermoplasmata archaeon]|nr:N-acetyltransferase [Thermoplasmata archaeon]